MVSMFDGKIVPNDCKLAGYTWLISHFELILPVRNFSCISKKRLSLKREEKEEWIIFDSQISYDESVAGHLEFAIKHELLDLLLIKRVIDCLDQKEITTFIKSNLKGIHRRKIWFYYEFFTNKKLEIEDLPAGKYENLISEKDYFTNTNIIKSKRHKINNNLLGTASFCPIIRKTKKLNFFIEKGLSGKSKKIVGKISPEILRRAASFLLLADSKASFEIEGERPPKSRIERWGKIINEAGKYDLSIDEIERLHLALIHNTKLLKIGLREDGVFLGERDREGDPLPEFIGAREEDLEELMKSWIDLNQILAKCDIDPILYTTIMAFSFVYIHPLEDGNGRIHRYLLHHILGRQKFYPTDMIFPISSVILSEIEKYREVLIAHSTPLMNCIEWKITEKKNVKVTNKTIDLYCYFDCTEASEFIYECAEKTIEELLPREIKYLESFDKSFKEAKDFIEMPDHKLKQLLTFIIHNGGKLSSRKKKCYFWDLPEDTQIDVEEIINDNFDLSEVY